MVGTRDERDDLGELVLLLFECSEVRDDRCRTNGRTGGDKSSSSSVGVGLVSIKVFDRARCEGAALALDGLVAIVDVGRGSEVDDMEPFLLRNTLVHRREASGTGRDCNGPSSGVTTLKEVLLDPEELDGAEKYKGRSLDPGAFGGGCL